MASLSFDPRALEEKEIFLSDKVYKREG